MRLIRVDTGYRHALGDRYHLLILCLCYGANWYDWQPLQASSALDRYQRFSVLWSLSYRRSSPGHPLVSCREAKKIANVWANDQRACGWHVQAIAIDGGRCICPLTKPSSVSISLVGIWYIRDWASVMWLIVLTHRAWNWRSLEFSFSVRHQLSHPYKQIDKFRDL